MADVVNDPADLAAALTEGFELLDLTPDPGQIQRLIQFRALLLRWNRVYNLVSVKGADDVVSRHLLDSVAVQRYITGSTMLDVGSGAGLPGIPLAVINQATNFVLLDASGKKTRFIRQAAIELQLANVRVEQRRVESWQPGEVFDTVIARAYASISTLVDTAAHLLAEGGRLLVMKGRHPADELRVVPSGFEVTGLHRLVVPGLCAERHLVQIERAP